MKHIITKTILKPFLFLALLLFCDYNGFGQNKIAAKIQNLQQENTQFTPIAVLTVDASIDKKDINEVVRSSTLAKAAVSEINQVASGQFEFLELEIPYQDQNIKILLYRVNPFTESFSIDTDKNRNISYQKGVHYRGIIKGNLQSVAAFNFFNGEFNGVFSSQELGNIVVGKIEKPNNQSDYIIYSDANFLKTNDFECHVEEKESTLTPTDLQRGVATNKCVTFYYEVDNTLFVSNGSNVTTTTNWMTSVHNNVQTLFENDGITVALNAIFIWTTPDVYTNAGASSVDYLQAFAAYRPNVNGDIGMLLGIDPGGLGGVAYLNSLCQGFNYAYSDLNGISVQTVPTYSWTTQVITHEFGHSLGSPHTHACVWNGNNTPIDGCGNQAGFPENGCTITGPIPSAAVRGTIMSYCHLVSGVGISFANGFGEQPRTLMTNLVNAKWCLSTDCVSTCYNTVFNIQTNTISNTSAMISWDDFDDAISWQMSVRPIGSASIWNTVSQPSLSLSGLLPNTYYRARLRPTCSTTTANITNHIFMTSGNYCESIPFNDTGGLTNNYSNSESFTRTITPNLPNRKIVVTFSQFALEDDYDFLYIYNGPDESYPELNNGNGFTNTNSPGTVISTAVDGALTFKFFSDQFVTAAGWSAVVSCQETLGSTSNNFVDFTYYPNPTNNKVTVKSNTAITTIEVYNIEGRKLFSQKLEAFESNVDLSHFASGTYFFKVKFNDLEKNFKVLKL
jgi:hypothetical protein